MASLTAKKTDTTSVSQDGALTNPALGSHAVINTAVGVDLQTDASDSTVPAGLIIPGVPKARLSLDNVTFNAEGRALTTTAEITSASSRIYVKPTTAIAVAPRLYLPQDTVTPSSFVSDTFTDTSGTVLSSHTGELGATWTRHTSRTAKQLQISNANRVRSNSTGDDRVCYYASGVPPTADYEVQCTVRRIDTTAFQYLGPAGRINTAAETMYYAEWVASATAWKLGKFVNGAETYIGSYSVTPTVGTDYVVKLQMRGTAIKLFIDGVERISATDSDITATGKAGIQGYWNNSGSDSTGHHVDTFLAAGVGTPSPSPGRTYSAVATTVRASSGAGTATSHNSFPSCVRLPDNTLSCSYRQSYTHLVQDAASKTTFQKKTSSDGGATWSAESTYLTDSTYDLRTNITRVDPKTNDLVMIYYGDELTGTNDPRSFFRRSTDGGTTWSAPVAFTTGNTGYGYNWIASSDLLIVKDTTAAYGYMFYATFYGVDTVGAIGTGYSRLVKSVDGGATWAAVATIQTAAQTGAVQNGEAQIVLLDTGRMYCVTRVQSSPLSFWGNYSDDSGATWSAPAQIMSSITNQPVLWQTPQGDLIFAGEGGAGTQTYTTYSRDRGTTWATKTAVAIIRAGAAMNGGMWCQVDDTNATGKLNLCYAEEYNTQQQAEVYFLPFTGLPYLSSYDLAINFVEAGAGGPGRRLLTGVG